MTTNLLPLLNRLHQAAPEMCQIQLIADNPHYIIGEYYFWFQGKELRASALKVCCAEGRPALDWLAGALMAAIEARHWGWDVRKDVTRGAFVFTPNASYEADHAGTTTEALLTALVAAVEAERVTKAWECIECGRETTSGNICDECSRDAGHFR